MNILRKRQSNVMLFLAAITLICMTAPGLATAAENKQKTGFLELGFGQYRDQTKTISTSDTSKITRFYGGHRFSDQIAVQLGYVDFAKNEFNTSGTKLTAEAHGLHAKATISLPFSRDHQGYSAFFISGGAWRWDIEATESTASARIHGANATAGAGLLFASDTTALKIEYERFFAQPKVSSSIFVSDVLDGKIKEDAITINLMFFL